MICRHAEPQLNALADHELPPWQAARVRRHLAVCPACTAEYAEIQRLDRTVQAWHDVPAPSTLGPRILAALPPFAVFHTRRRAFPVRPAAVGLAGIAAAVAAVLWFLPGQPGQPTLAYADVEQAMEQVQTVSWATTTHTRFVGRTGRQSETDSTMRSWLRRRPAAIVTFQQPNGYPRGIWSLEDGRGQMTRYDNSYQVHKADVDMKQLVEQQIQSMTQAPTETIQSKPSGATHAATAPLQEHETTLNGRTQILFIRDYNCVTTPTPAPAKMLHISENTWVDPTTHRVTQIEIDNVGGFMGPGWHSSSVENDFQYNQTPPPGVFDWSPPKGTKVTKF